MPKVRSFLFLAGFPWVHDCEAVALWVDQEVSETSDGAVAVLSINRISGNDSGRASGNGSILTHGASLTVPVAAFGPPTQHGNREAAF